jgi:hypothetical protein
MQADSSQPSTADIRQVLLKSFRDEELTALCFDYFPDVYDTFAAGTTKEHKVQLLIEHCVRRELVPNLLAAIQRAQAEQQPARFPSARPEPAGRERDLKQIFISHAHEDAAFAHRLAGDLRNNGWRVWIAPESIRPGEKWVEAINRGLDESGVFLLILTPKAVQSTWVMDETNVAIEYQHEGHLRFIPLEVERCIVPPLWRVYQRVSFLGRHEAGLSQLWTELGGADEKAVPRDQIPTPPSLQKPTTGRAADRRTPPSPAKVPKPLQGSPRAKRNPLPFLLAGAGAVAVALVVLVIMVVSDPPATLRPAMAPVTVVTQVSPKDSMVLVYVPAGEFLMGSSKWDLQPENLRTADSEKPQHKVYLDAFGLIGRR